MTEKFKGGGTHVVSAESAKRILHSSRSYSENVAHSVSKSPTSKEQLISEVSAGLKEQQAQDFYSAENQLKEKQKQAQLKEKAESIPAITKPVASYLNRQGREVYLQGLTQTTTPYGDVTVRNARGEVVSQYRADVVQAQKYIKQTKERERVQATYDFLSGEYAKKPAEIEAYTFDLGNGKQVSVSAGVYKKIANEKGELTQEAQTTFSEIAKANQYETKIKETESDFLGRSKKYEEWKNKSFWERSLIPPVDVIPFISEKTKSLQQAYYKNQFYPSEPKEKTITALTFSVTPTKIAGTNTTIPSMKWENKTVTIAKPAEETGLSVNEVALSLFGFKGEKKEAMLNVVKDYKLGKSLFVGYAEFANKLDVQRYEKMFAVKEQLPKIPVINKTAYEIIYPKGSQTLGERKEARIQWANFAYGTVEGIAEQVFNKPIQTLSYVAIGFAIPVGSAYLRAGTFATKAEKAVNIGRGIFKWGVAPAIVTSYVGIKTFSIAVAPTYEQKGNIFGQTLVETGAFMVGGYYGTKVAKPILEKPIEYTQTSRVEYPHKEDVGGTIVTNQKTRSFFDKGVKTGDKTKWYRELGIKNTVGGKVEKRIETEIKGRTLAGEFKGYSFTEKLKGGSSQTVGVFENKNTLVSFYQSAKTGYILKYYKIGTGGKLSFVGTKQLPNTYGDYFQPNKYSVVNYWKPTPDTMGKIRLQKTGMGETSKIVSRTERDLFFGEKTFYSENAFRKINYNVQYFQQQTAYVDYYKHISSKRNIDTNQFIYQKYVETIPYVKFVKSTPTYKNIYSLRNIETEGFGLSKTNVEVRDFIKPPDLYRTGKEFGEGTVTYSYKYGQKPIPEPKVNIATQPNVENFSWIKVLKPWEKQYTYVISGKDRFGNPIWLKIPIETNTLAGTVAKPINYASNRAFDVMQKLEQDNIKKYPFVEPPETPYTPRNPFSPSNNQISVAKVETILKPVSVVQVPYTQMKAPSLTEMSIIPEQTMRQILPVVTAERLYTPVVTRLEITPVATTKSILSIKAVTEIRTLLQPQTKTVTNLLTRTATKTATVTKTATRTATKTATVTEVVTITPTITITPTVTKAKVIPKVQIPPEFKPPTFDYPSSKSNRGLYKTLVRRRGKFMDVGTFSEPRPAFIRGKTIVSTTAGASFKVKGGESFEPFSAGIISRKQFYESRKEPNVYIEKRGQRIKSRGELKEITYKGIQANRFKAKKNKIKWGF